MITLNTKTRLIATVGLLATAQQALAASDVADAVMRGDAAELAALLERAVDVNEAQPDGAALGRVP